MSIPDNEKIDFLLKKVGFELAKTDKAANKSIDNETKSSPINVRSSNVWLGSIPSTTGTPSSNVAKSFTRLTPDSTVTNIAGNSPTWIASSGDWLSSSYGSDYRLKVYIGNSGNYNNYDDLLSGGGSPQLINSAGAGINDGFIFDYTAGILHFGNTTIPTGLRTAGKVIYLDGYRYVGPKGQGVTGSGNFVLQSGALLASPTITGTATFDNITTNTLTIDQPNNVNSTGTIGMWNINFTAGQVLNFLNRRGDINLTAPSGRINLAGQSGITLVSSGVNSTVLISGANINISGQTSFNLVPTVTGIAVSLSGHKHVYTDVTDFCSGVASCVTTELISATGIQFTSGNDFLRISLSGQALSLHNLASTGFFVRTSAGSITSRSLASGANINISNGDGSSGNPTISLSPSVTGLSYLSIDNITIDASTISTISNNNLVIDPNGTGQIQLDAGIIRVGETNATATVTTNGGNLVFNTSSNTTNPNITLNTGTNANIDITAAGTGEVNINRADIDGGSIDGTTIGGSSAAAGTFTTLTANNGATINGDLNVTNNLIVGGDTIIANVSRIEIEDATIRLGATTGTITNNALDRGVEFIYTTGTPAIGVTGFFGWDTNGNNGPQALGGSGLFVLLSNVTGVGAGGSGDYLGTFGHLRVDRLQANRAVWTTDILSTSGFWNNDGGTVRAFSGIFGEVLAGSIGSASSGVQIFTTGINLTNEIANTIAHFDASKNLKSLSTATYPSLTELSYVKGVNSSIQTQLDNTVKTTGTQTIGGIKTFSDNIIANSSIRASSGTLSVPSFSFIDDTDTGFYSPTANSIRISTSGTDRLSVTSSGAVGIGTTSPQWGLHFVSAVTGSNSDGFYLGQNNNSRYLRLSSAGLLTNTTFTVGSATDDTTSQLYVNTNATSRIGLTVQGVVGQSANLLEVDAHNGTTLFRVSSIGGGYFADRVGINTTTPSGLLDVAGSGYITTLLGNTIKGFGLQGTSHSGLCLITSSISGINNTTYLESFVIDGGSP